MEVERASLRIHNEIGSEVMAGFFKHSMVGEINHMVLSTYRLSCIFAGRRYKASYDLVNATLISETGNPFILVEHLLHTNVTLSQTRTLQFLKFTLVSLPNTLLQDAHMYQRLH